MGPTAELVERIDRTLAGFLAARARDLALVGVEPVALADTARDFVLAGGKRLRPMFAYWGWRAHPRPVEPDDAMVAASASLELMHACALVHDDVMDASATRRGRPSAHAAFVELHRERGFTGDPRVFGTAAAILLGDLLLCWADQLFAEAGFAADVRRRARPVYDAMRQQVMAGQYLDALVQARGDFSVDDALRVITYKTAKYTVDGPLQFGAAAAGAPLPVRDALQRYGLALGEAFQLRDDVLGVYGDPARTGKPAGDDLREGKRTVLVCLAMRDATPAQAATLRNRLGDRGLDATAIAEVREVIVAAGALAAVEARIAARTADAHAALTEAPIDPVVSRVLADLADAASQRTT